MVGLNASFGWAPLNHDSLARHVFTQTSDLSGAEGLIAVLIGNRNAIDQNLPGNERPGGRADTTATEAAQHPSCGRMRYTRAEAGTKTGAQ